MKGRPKIGHRHCKPRGPKLKRTRPDCKGCHDLVVDLLAFMEQEYQRALAVRRKARRDELARYARLQLPNVRANETGASGPA
jgi:hypothetical protein